MLRKDYSQPCFCSLSFNRWTGTWTPRFTNMLSRVIAFLFISYSLSPRATHPRISSNHTIQVGCSISPLSFIHLADQICTIFCEVILIPVNILRLSRPCCRSISIKVFCIWVARPPSEPRCTFVAWTWNWLWINAFSCYTSKPLAVFPQMILQVKFHCVHFWCAQRRK